MARKFCEETFGDKFLYTISIHNPAFDNNPNKNAKGEKNIHAHIMFCLKRVDLDNKMPMEQFSNTITGEIKIDQKNYVLVEQKLING